MGRSSDFEEEKFFDKANGSPEYIIFEKPGKVFNYTANGERELDTRQVQQLMVHLCDIRDNITRRLAHFEGQ